MKKELILENIEILDAGAEGKAVGKYENKVVFVPYAVPGDVVNVRVFKKRKSYMHGKIIKIVSQSEKRTAPRCKHFGVCGGCTWQNMAYDDQLFYKQKQVTDNLSRIGKFVIPDVLPILPSENIYYYRNKLEFSFSNKKWLTEYSKDLDFNDLDMNALGFFMPGMFDRVLDIEECYLQQEPSNRIRLAVREFTAGFDYYDVKKWEGFLRNLIVRNTTTGDLMVILVVRTDDQDRIYRILDFLAQKFPEISSLMYVVNDKKNSVISDLEIKLYQGNPFIIEEMEGLKFKIGPVSFFQTNSFQAYELYKVVRDFAELTGNEIVYDLYTGTGTIANFISETAKKVIGIEYIESAVNDARENSKLNNISNTVFYAGDIAKVLDDEFVDSNGRPDVVVTDPPRAGMHPDILRQLLNIAPDRIVYVSCNPATQARDLNELAQNYSVVKIQPVDMFPHTQHVENVVLLKKD